MRWDFEAGWMVERHHNMPLSACVNATSWGGGKLTKKENGLERREEGFIMVFVVRMGRVLRSWIYGGGGGWTMTGEVVNRSDVNGWKRGLLFTIFSCFCDGSMGSVIFFIAGVIVRLHLQCRLAFLLCSTKSRYSAR